MSLKQKVISGAKWAATGTGAVTLARLGSLAVLARLLDPADFGLVGMVMVVVGFVNSFTDVGLSSAIVQRKDPTREQLSSLYWLNLAVGLVLFFVTLLSVPLVAAYYEEPRLRPLLRLAALTFLISPFGMQFRAILEKELRFKSLAGVDAAGALANAAVSIWFALAGRGVYSLIYGQLAQVGVTAVFLAAVSDKAWFPRLHFSIPDLRGYLGFGAYQMGERALNYFSQNVDYLVIGKYLGAAPLGYYTLAYNLVSYPQYRITPIVAKVVFPAFAKVQDDKAAMNRGFLKSVSILSFINFPLAVGLAIAARPLVLSLYGPKWASSIVLVQILLVVGLIKSLAAPFGAIILAKGRAHVSFAFNVVVCITNAAVCWIAVYPGVVILSAALAGVYLLRYVLVNVVFLRWLTGVRSRDFWPQIVPSAVLSAIMAAGLLILHFGVLKPLGILQSPVPALAWMVVTGALLYFGAARLWQPRLLAEMLALVWSRPDEKGNPPEEMKEVAAHGR